MKKLLLLAVVALAALNLTGCVIVKSETTIADDGSGTAEISMSISPTVLEALKEMQELDGGQSGNMDFPLLDDFDRDTIDAAGKDYGVKVTSFERGLVDGRETVQLSLAFADLKGFSYVMGTIMGEGDDNGGMGIFDAGEGNLVLRQAEYDFPPRAKDAEDATPEPNAAPEMDPAKMQRQMELVGLLMGAMAETDVQFRFTVPGDIISTNAPETEGRTSIWAINASNMMSMDQDMDPQIVFAGQGLKIKPLQD